MVVLSATVFAHYPTVSILARQRGGGKSIDAIASCESCVKRGLMWNYKCIGSWVKRPLAANLFAKENRIGKPIRYSGKSYLAQVVKHTRLCFAWGHVGGCSGLVTAIA